MMEVTLRSDVSVQLVKHSASDSDVIWAARVSTAGERSLEDVSGDSQRSRGLINYLLKNCHGTPFEHNSLTFFIQAPIFVFREFHRHRAGWSYNEESGRYRELSPVFYTPGSDRCLIQEGKPGHYKFAAGTALQHLACTVNMREAYRVSYESYQTMLQQGIAREVARMVLPVGIYSSMYATCNARSLMHFLSLRTTNEQAIIPSFPQREIEMVAEKMEDLWKNLMPLTHEAYNINGRRAP